MRTTILSLFAVFALTVTAQTNTVTNTAGWVSAPVTVTPVTVRVRPTDIRIQVTPTDMVTVTVLWQWVDTTTGKIVHRGTSVFTQSEIDAKLKAHGASVDMFRAIFLSIAETEAAKP